MSRPIEVQAESSKGHFEDDFSLLDHGYNSDSSCSVIDLPVLQCQLIR